MKQSMVIGKYTLESLTNGMYASPLDLYREYIQNSVDSIDEAIKANIIKKEESEIYISIDQISSSISITDNGCGLPKSTAVSTLIDIGNSNKDRSYNRGFRGIGRLAGLGYCEELIFSTSFQGEAHKTIVKYDAKKLKSLLISNNTVVESIYDVIDAVVETKVVPEKAKKHYFEVQLINVDASTKLTNHEYVKEYLVQHAPLNFSKDFKWGKVIEKKLEAKGFSIPCYSIVLESIESKEPLYKPYSDIIVSDRVKKLEDSISEINVEVLETDNKPTAVIWYASTSFLGTILNRTQKGLRIRQGNILIGDSLTCNPFFKEERFNGWVIGEIHILDSNLIINSRRDNFENTQAYLDFEKSLSEFTNTITKTIRQCSYERNLKEDKLRIIRSEKVDDVNSLLTEDLFFTDDIDENYLQQVSESESVAEGDFFNKLSMLINKKEAQTRYAALNINENLTSEQRKTLERVFDLISENYGKKTTEKFINTIAVKF